MKKRWLAECHIYSSAKAQRAAPPCVHGFEQKYCLASVHEEFLLGGWKEGPLDPPCNLETPNFISG